MSKLMILGFFLISNLVISQTKIDNYFFDYVTVYDTYINNPEEKFKEVTVANSNDSTFVLTFEVRGNNISETKLVDFKNLSWLSFKEVKNALDWENFKFLILEKKLIYNLDYCLEKKHVFYNIEYSKKPSFNEIHITGFRNKKKTNLKIDFYINTIPTDIVKNQHCSFIPLIAPIRCQKFQLKNSELISESYIIKNNKKTYVRLLNKINSINYTLSLD